MLRKARSLIVGLFIISLSACSAGDEGLNRGSSEPLPELDAVVANAREAVDSVAATLPCSTHYLFEGNPYSLSAMYGHICEDDRLTTYAMAFGSRRPMVQELAEYLPIVDSSSRIYVGEEWFVVLDTSYESQLEQLRLNGRALHLTDARDLVLKEAKNKIEEETSFCMVTGTSLLESILGRSNSGSSTAEIGQPYPGLEEVVDRIVDGLGHARRREIQLYAKESLSAEAAYSSLLTDIRKYCRAFAF